MDIWGCYLVSILRWIQWYKIGNENMPYSFHLSYQAVMLEVWYWNPFSPTMIQMAFDVTYWVTKTDLLLLLGSVCTFHESWLHFGSLCYPWTNNCQWPYAPISIRRRNIYLSCFLVFKIHLKCKRQKYLSHVGSLASCTYISKD